MPTMDRGELLDALEELQTRLDIADMADVEYESLSDSVATLKDMVARRKL